MNLAKSVENLMHTLESSDNVSLMDQLLPTPALPKGSHFFQGVHKCLVFIDDYRIMWNDEPANTEGKVADMAPLAELEDLRERLKQTELLVDCLLADSLGGGVTITGGLRYDSEEQVHEFLREISSKVALPPHSWGSFMTCGICWTRLVQTHLKSRNQMMTLRKHSTIKRRSICLRRSCESLEG